MVLANGSEDLFVSLAEGKGEDWREHFTFENEEAEG